MIRFLIVLALLATCIYFLVTKTDFTPKTQPQQIKPVKMENVFDVNAAKQKGLERQRRIDNGEF